jgi:L-alanine-DL-glutamate epimerase-like enolase superfamily enzyme
VTAIRAVTPISVRYPEPNDNGAVRHLTLCRIEADDGTVGWGEAVTSWPDACRATEAMIEGIATELVVGRDPLDNVDIWRSCRRRAWWYGNRGGISSFALSAIDIALWDLKGRLLGVPVVQLLGGAQHERLPAVASTHPAAASLEQEADRHARYVSALGLQGCKLGLGKAGEARLGSEIARDVELIRLLRERVGPEPMLMWDRGVNTLTWDASFAIRLTTALEPYGLTWIEEPFEPEDVDSFRRLKSRCTTLVASGEREWNVEGYRSFIATGVADVIGFDPGRAEGITGGRRVIELVEEADAWFNAHAWSSAIVSAASLALSLTTPRARVFELKPEENPMQHELVDSPIEARNGYVEPLRGAGLGIDVRESVVDRYRF